MLNTNYVAHDEAPAQVAKYKQKLADLKQIRFALFASKTWTAGPRENFARSVGVGVFVAAFIAVCLVMVLFPKIEVGTDKLIFALLSAIFFSAVTYGPLD